jgi:hypothetical protein
LRGKGLESHKIEELQLPFFDFQIFLNDVLSFESVSVPKKKQEIKKDRSLLGVLLEKGMKSLKI